MSTNTNNSINSYIPIQVPLGGTQDATLTQDGVMVGNGTSPVIVTAAGTNGQVLVGATGAAPAFTTLTSPDGSITFTPGVNTLALEAVSSTMSPIVTNFSTSGTWTINAKTSNVQIVMINGGSGGGSGRQGLTTASGGGAGGSGGAYVSYWAPANFWNSAGETVTVGAGGAGGLTQGSASTNGIIGTAGGFTSVGNVNCATVPQSGTLYGGGGTTTATVGGTSGLSLLFGPIFAINAETLDTSSDGGNGGNTTGTNAPTVGGSNQAYTIAPSGGGGGSGANSITAQQAGNGGNIAKFSSATTFIAGGAGGIESGTVQGANGNPGFTTTGGRPNFGSGGGGGGGMSVIAPGTGGNGALGAGGGGGGGSINGTTSGAGGAGGNGYVIIIET